MELYILHCNFNIYGSSIFCRGEEVRNRWTGTELAWDIRMYQSTYTKFELNWFSIKTYYEGVSILSDPTKKKLKLRGNNNVLFKLINIIFYYSKKVYNGLQIQRNCS